VVLIHGSLGDYRDWERQIGPFIKSGFKVLSYSRRNHYPNPWKDYPTNYSLRTERDDLVEILKKRGEKAHLIGHSYGGYVAALAARDYPGLVNKLVMAEPPIFTLLEDGEDLMLARKFSEDVIKPATNSLKENHVEESIRTFLDGITGSKDVYDRLKPKYRSVMISNANTALVEIGITEERDPFDCEDASGISATTLLVKGTTSPKLLQSIVVQLGNPKLRTYPELLME
jgi:non-heme chloroperoxidase